MRNNAPHAHESTHAVAGWLDQRAYGHGVALGTQTSPQARLPVGQQ
jgi:hypothetical protein